jgi:FkbM family methyltransferase
VAWLSASPNVKSCESVYSGMKKLIGRVKVMLRILLGKDVFARPAIRRTTKRFGSDYGGWDIIPDLLNEQSVVYSFGVGEDASFDIGLLEAFGMSVHAFDPTPQSLAWVSEQQFPDRFVMHPVGIASFDGEVTFNPPENPSHISHTMLERPSTSARAITVPVQRLSSICADLGHENIDILKIDIEGAEYDVIDDILASDIRPGQFLIEFHTRFPGVGKTRTQNAIELLRSAGYVLYHVSPSNEEFCFVHAPGA